MIPESEAKLSIYDSALMFGDMVFEMMRTFNKQTFKLWEHIERLFKSANYLDIKIPYSFDKLYNEHENLILHNRKMFEEDDEIRTLINVSRGLLPIYEPMGKLETQVIISCFPLRYITKGISKHYKQGGIFIRPKNQITIKTAFTNG
jgi:branched-chain amino acid aminotransferase